MKGVITVKKLISVILALVLLSACCVSLAEGAAETTGPIQFFLPAELAMLNIDELPVNDFPLVRTKRVHEITTITVNGEVDRMTANWMGYGESPEEVTLTDGIGEISSEGHKYSVGTHYVTANWIEWLDGYDYYGQDETFADAEKALKAEHAAEIKKGANIKNYPFVGFAVYHYRWVYYTKGDEMYTIDSTYERIGSLYTTYEEAKAAAQALGPNTSKKEFNPTYGADVTTEEGYGVERIGGYADLLQRKWAYSNGWPNRAYTIYTGEYAVDYTRGGDINYVSRTMENTDLLSTGIEGAITTINWEVNIRKKQYVPKVTGFSVVYPEGSPISSISVSYNGKKMYRYTIKYNVGKGESYVATYSSKDRLCSASYLQGETVIAKHSKGSKWVNVKTGLYEHFLEPVDGPLCKTAVRVQ